MKIAHKLWLLLIALSAVASVAIGMLDFRVAVANLRAQDDQHYNNLGKSIGRVLLQVDTTTDAVLRNALEVFSIEDARSGPLDADKMQALAKSLSVDRLGWASRDGWTQVYTEDPNAKNVLNLFTLCDEYEAKWFDGPGEVITTPFAPKAVPSVHGFDAEKFAASANRARDRILSVSLRSSEWQRLFLSAVDDDKNILKIGLSTPSGATIATVCNDSYASAECEGATNTQDFRTYTFYSESSTSACCECVAKGYVERGQPYHYVLTLTVKNEQIQRTANALRLRSMGVMLTVLAISAVGSHFLARRLTTGVEALARAADTMTQSSDVLVGVPYRGGNDEIDRLALSFNHMVERLRDSEKERVLKERAEALAKQAAQVAHDIRSPLTSLHAVVDDSFGLPENDRNTIRNGVRRITDIANNLFQGMRSNANNWNKLQPELVSLAVEQVASEQRILRASGEVDFSVDIDDDARSTFSSVVASKLKCVLSNLLNNAFESLENPTGRVTVRLRRQRDRLEILITDTGCGIAPESLHAVLAPGGASSKRGGFGMGLSDAAASLRAWNGSLTLCSAPGHGTTVQLRLPVCGVPPWFCRRITLKARQTVLVLDDDPSVHDALHRKLTAPFDAERMPFVAVSSIEAFCAYVQKHRAQIGLCLVDYQVAKSLRTTGLDVIRELDIGPYSTLVTSWDEDEEVREECVKLGITLVPKSHIPYLTVTTDV